MAKNDINIGVKTTGEQQASADIDKLCDSVDTFIEAASKAPDTKKYEAYLKKIKKTVAQIRDEFSKNAQEVQSVASDAFDRIGISVGRLNTNVAIFISQIPGIGKALAALRTALMGPLGWILAGIGAVVTAFGQWKKNASEAQLRIDRIKLDNIKSTLKTINEDMEQYLHLLEIAAEKRKNEKEKLEEQIDAQHELNNILREREKIKAGYAGMTEEDRFEIEHSAEADANRADLIQARQKNELEREENEQEIKDIQKQLQRLQDNVVQYESEAKRASASAKEIRDRFNSVIYHAPVAGDVASSMASREENEALAKEFDDAASEANKSLREALKEIDKLNVKMGSLKNKRGVFSDVETKLNEQENLNADKLRRSREEEALRRGLAIEERAREKMVRERSEQDTEDEYMRNREPWRKNLEEKMENVSERMARFAEEADKATEAMSALEEANKDAADWTEEDKRAYERAKEDRERAMTQWRTAQQEMDAFELEKKQRQWDNRDRTKEYEREDREFERQKKSEFLSWDAKVAKETERMNRGKEMREKAQAILDNNFEKLSPRKLAIFEANRDRGRAMELEARSNLHNLAREGDRDTAAFEAKMRGQGGNRLTAMGLGGDAVDFSRETAKNTGKLVLLTREMMTTFKGGHLKPRAKLGEVTWTMN